MAEKDQKELAKVYFSIMIGRLFFYQTKYQKIIMTCDTIK